MGEPVTHSDTETGYAEPLLSQAAQRLERALAALEAALARAPSSRGDDMDALDGRTEALVIELDAARRRQHALSDVAADASMALGRAMTEVRRTLEEDAERQGVLDLEAQASSEGEPQGLEVQAGSPEEEDAEPRPPEEESTA